MLQLTHTSFASTGELLDSALDTIEFYGFAPIEHVTKTRATARKAVERAAPTLYTPREKKLAALTKTLIGSELHKAQSPRSFYTLDTSASKVTALTLHVSGSTGAIAEGMLLATLAEIAATSGIKDITLHINSLGDKESHLRYVRELTQFLRARINDLPAPARDDLQDGHPLRALARLIEKQHEAAAHAPNPMEFLNDESRTHLHDVLEHIEHLNIPYELDPALVGSGDCWHHTLFELRTHDEHNNPIVVAHGGRHDALAYKTYRANLPVVSAIFEHEVHGRTKPKRRLHTPPRLFFAQLGVRAKMKSFAVLAQLHSTGIPIAQLVTVESIGGQLSYAEQNHIPYTVIIGHKEALDDTAVVRNMENRSQVVVPLAQLPAYLKKLKV